ncbi:MAG: hypothetical protein NTV23_11945 [Propionibacteriales bacterium]|nr:hypothetical protein [Propionibacteriales bacterium]
MTSGFLDNHVARAWFAFRLDLAERLASGPGERITFGYGGQRSVSLYPGPGGVVIHDGDDVDMFTSVDEAAMRVSQLLHDREGVVHPAFLDAGSPVAAAIREPAPLLGRASSRQLLQDWVHATLEAEFPGPLKVFENGNVAWRNEDDLTIVVRAQNIDRIDLWVTLGFDVDVRKAHRTADKLSAQHVGFNFRMIGTALVMMQSLEARPFVPEHLVKALRRHMRVTNELGWVHEKIRCKPERTLAGTTRVAPELLALLPVARSLGTAELADELTRAAAGARGRLRSWRSVANQAREQARHLPRGDDDPHQVNRSLRISWQRLVDGLDLAIARWTPS